MFNKLLRNLPFNPSLIDQVTFYGKRLRQESGVRRAGFALIAITMALQVFATISPAQASVEGSVNDIIRNGFQTKQQAIDHCNNKNEDFKTILNYYGITCDAVASSTETTILSTSQNNNLISVGRRPENKPNVSQLTIPGVQGTLYWRPLSSWGTFNAKVLVTHTTDNQTVMIMFDCGNLVTLKDFKLSHPEPSSDIKIVKKNSPTGEVKHGDTIDYTLIFTNSGGTAAFFSINDVLPSQLSYVSSGYSDWIFENKTPNLKWHPNVPFATFGNTDSFGTPGFITLKTKVNDNVPSGTTICNTAYAQDVIPGTTQLRNTAQTQVCNTVVVTCPEGQILKDDGLTCTEVIVPDAACISLIAEPVTKNIDNKKFNFTSQAQALKGATITSYDYNFGDGSTLPSKSTSNKNVVTHEFSTAKTYDVSVTVKTSVADKSALTCTTKIVVNPAEVKPIIAIKKGAANITKKQTDANNQTASAGDVIEYTLTSSNISDVDAKDYVLQPEDLADVLEYSTLDMNTLQGGTFDSKTQYLEWTGKVTIKAHEAIKKVFRVTVKDPIPSTPSPTSLTYKGAGDMVMHNTYGKSVIDINLPKTPVKVIEQTTTTTTLVKTGPGESLLIGFITMTIIGYFFARSRLLTRELELVKQEYTSTSGGL